MRNVTANIFLGTGFVAVLFAAALAAPSSWAAGGTVPSTKTCNDKNNPPQDIVTQGGCLIIHRRKGNCVACHQVPGATAHGNVAPPLVSMKQRFPDRTRLRGQIDDPRRFNPDTVMPPFGAHNILSQDEIDQVVEFLYML